MANRAGRQRISALKSILLGIVLAGLPWGLPALFAQLPVLTSLTQPLESALESVLPWLPWGCWAIAAILVGSGLRQFLAASQGSDAIGTSVMPVLRPLQRQGWQFQSSVGTGDNQTVARSPQGQTFCIVVKSERGRIGCDGRTVFRLVDQSKNPFPVDFVSQTKQRAARVQQRLKLSKVVPVLAFSDAMVAIDSNPVVGVYVVQAQDLRLTLMELA